MKKVKRTHEEVVSMFNEVKKMVASGMETKSACAQAGITTAQFYTAKSQEKKKTKKKAATLHTYNVPTGIDPRYLAIIKGQAQAILSMCEVHNG